MKLVITGPRSVGKSTISKIVAQKLDVQYISSDELGEKKLKKYGGLDKAIKSGKISEMIKEKGYDIILKNLKKDNFVFDLSGGSISSRRFPEASKEIREAVKNSAIVIGLLPFKNKKKSVKLLVEREGKREHFKRLDKEELVKQTEKDFYKFPPLFKKFCDYIVYTENKSPEEIVGEIMIIILKKK
jgi:shikimate kinase